MKALGFFAFLRALHIFQPIFTFNMTLERYCHIDYNSYVNFEIFHEMMAVNQKEKLAKS